MPRNRSPRPPRADAPVSRYGVETLVPRQSEGHWSLATVLLLVVAGVVAFGSMRASGTERVSDTELQQTSAAAVAMGDGRAVEPTPKAIPTPTMASAPGKVAAIPEVIQPVLPSPPPAAARANEVGQILMLQYHVFTMDPENEGQWVRTIDDFRADLEWLHANNFYVVPLRDVFLNRIAAPRGKHPVVLTFDDGTAGQFRLLPQSDGSLQVDPNSAVGVLEEMFTRYPDFGRGGHFAVLPFNCFHVPDEPDQIPYCETKLRWLQAHGYEVGNHTAGHTDLLDVDDDEFKSTIGQAIEWAQATSPGSTPDILTMPFGNYPDPQKHPEQWRWLREGFDYDGRKVHLLGALMVNGGFAPSPASVLWDPLQVPRAQAFDDILADVQAYVTANQDLLYTSDGDPNTITVLANEPPQLQGAFDPSKATGRKIIVN